ncbi:MAG: TRC40/GET3/ArsA family transport-energizing ATPase [Acidobacteriota bacterium]|nr:TRC40/GET3/ArsA family transport-energizing ATPase [Acidobacteriota bacterium]
MRSELEQLMRPRDGVRHLFFGGKGGVGKTTLATATAVWLADSGYETTIVSTDPTVSLAAMFAQEIGGRELVAIHEVQRLCGLNINPADARGVFQSRLSELTGQISGTFGDEMIATPCADEMAAFDQFVGFLEQPPGEVVVFDTAPTGKTLRELAMPFDWAGFLKRQIEQGKELAQLLNTDEQALAGLERDRRRYETALAALRDPATTVFTLVLMPERLPIEETASAISGLARLGIPVQALATNQVIPAEAIQGNRLLGARARLQARYLDEIDGRFADLRRVRLPLLDSDVSDLATLRRLAAMLYGPVASPAVAASRS